MKTITCNESIQSLYLRYTKVVSRTLFTPQSTTLSNKIDRSKGIV